nr:MAG TPA: hypothetical protein [Ackermannviridae sp.]
MFNSYAIFMQVLCPPPYLSRVHIMVHNSLPTPPILASTTSHTNEKDDIKKKGCSVIRTPLSIYTNIL